MGQLEGLVPGLVKEQSGANHKLRVVDEWARRQASQRPGSHGGEGSIMDDGLECGKT